MQTVSTSNPPLWPTAAGAEPVVRIVVVPPSERTGSQATPCEEGLATLAAAGAVFAEAASAPDILDGIGRLLVGSVADWSLFVPRSAAPSDEPLSLFVSPALGATSFHAVPPTRVLELEGTSANGPNAVPGPSWTTEGVLHLRSAEGPVPFPAGPLGRIPLEAERLRFGAVLLGRMGERGAFDARERGLVVELTTRTSRALENAEVGREARRAARIRDAVVDMVVHDLTTPLSALELVVDRMVTQCESRGTGDALDRYGQSAHRAVDQIRGLLSDLADLRAMEQGMFSADLSAQPVCRILSAARDRVGAMSLDREVGLHLTTEACPLRVVADPVRTVQCLVNLLAHAIEASPPGETVFLIPRRAGDRAEIDVVDRGPGIPEDRLPYLFDRYAWARGYDGRRRRLGLTIAQEIALAHGESLRVDTGPGRGTRFTLSLALAPGDPGGSGSDAAEVEDQAGTRRPTAGPGASLSTMRNESRSS